MPASIVPIAVRNRAESPIARCLAKKVEPEALAENADPTIDSFPSKSASASGCEEFAVLSVQACVEGPSRATEAATHFPSLPGSKHSGLSALITQVSDPRAAVRGANFLYTGVWTSMGQEAESAARLKAFRDGGYQVSEALIRLAAPGARFLHCLPARRGEEVSASVIEGPASAILPQAENRLHAQKGLVAWLTGKEPGR